MSLTRKTVRLPLQSGRVPTRIHLRLIDPVSYQVIGIRQLSTGIGPKNIASCHITPRVRQQLAGQT